MAIKGPGNVSLEIAFMPGKVYVVENIRKEKWTRNFQVNVVSLWYGITLEVDKEIMLNMFPTVKIIGLTHFRISVATWKYKKPSLTSIKEYLIYVENDEFAIYHVA